MKKIVCQFNLKECLEAQNSKLELSLDSLTESLLNTHELY